MEKMYPNFEQQKHLAKIIFVRWETIRDGEWYVSSNDGRRLLFDSEFVDFPIDMAKFGESDSDALVIELKKIFPRCEIDLDID